VIRPDQSQQAGAVFQHELPSEKTPAGEEHRGFEWRRGKRGRGSVRENLVAHSLISGETSDQRVKSICQDKTGIQRGSGRRLVPLRDCLS
jgi:hypothetical protein